MVFAHMYMLTRFLRATTLHSVFVQIVFPLGHDPLVFWDEG